MFLVCEIASLLKRNIIKLLNGYILHVGYTNVWNCYETVCYGKAYLQ